MLRRLLDRIEEHLVSAALLAMALLVFAQVISRHFLHQSFSFTEEIVRYLLIWATMLGAAAATRQKAHLGMVYLSRVFPHLKTFTAVLGLVAMAALFAVVFVSSLCVVRLQIETVQRTPGLRWPIVWVTLAVSVGSALIVLRALQALGSEMRKR